MFIKVTRIFKDHTPAKIITVNTNHIIRYGEFDNKCTVLIMFDGSTVDIKESVEYLDSILVTKTPTQDILYKKSTTV